MTYLIPTLFMFLILIIIIVVALILKSRIPKILHPVLLGCTLLLSLYVIYKMLPGALQTVLQGVIDNVSRSTGIF